MISELKLQINKSIIKWGILMKLYLFYLGLLAILGASCPVLGMESQAASPRPIFMSKKRQTWLERRLLEKKQQQEYHQQQADAQWCIDCLGTILCAGRASFDITHSIAQADDFNNGARLRQWQNIFDYKKAAKLKELQAQEMKRE